MGSPEGASESCFLSSEEGQGWGKRPQYEGSAEVIAIQQELVLVTHQLGQRSCEEKDVQKRL